MAPDDRDRSFEKALALRLRANLPAAGCPDAETLAAYHERSMTSDELNSWKLHIASCASCQQVLAHLEALDQAPLGALAEQQSSSEAGDLVGVRARDAVVHDAHRVAVPKRASAVSVAQFPKQQSIRNWRWIVPAGAIAAGLLVWIAVQEYQPAAVLPAAKVEIAQNRPPAEESKVAAPTPAKPEALDHSAALAKPAAPTGDRGSVSSALQNRRDKSAASVPAANIPAPTNRSEAIAGDSENAQLSAKAQSGQDTRIYGLAGGISTGAAGAAVGGVAGAQKEKKFDEPAQHDQAMNYVAAPATPQPRSARQSGAPSKQEDEKQMQAKQFAAAPAASPAQTQQFPPNTEALPAKIPAMAETAEVTSAPASASTSPTDELKQPTQDVSATSTQARSASEGVTATSTAKGKPAMRMAKTRAPRSVSAPGGKIIWRLGFGGLIEQSPDGGQTWMPQSSGTTETLFLGSAPSEQVCWVISSSGTILRTTDGGATWARVVSPIPQNLGLIRASDALHATVWDTSRRQVFQTANGGVTWEAGTAH